MRVALCRGRIGVSKKTADDCEAQPARNEVRGVGVAVVVNSIVAQLRRLADLSPELLEFRDWAAGRSPRER